MLVKLSVYLNKHSFHQTEYSQWLMMTLVYGQISIADMAKGFHEHNRGEEAWKMSNTQISDRIPLETERIQHHSPHKSIKQYIQATCMPSIIVEMSWRHEEEGNREVPSSIRSIGMGRAPFARNTHTVSDEHTHTVSQNLFPLPKFDWNSHAGLMCIS